jgi:hypothetical protein
MPAGCHSFFAPHVGQVERVGLDDISYLTQPTRESRPVNDLVKHLSPSISLVQHLLGQDS